MRGLDVKIYLVTPRGVRVLDENLSDRDPGRTSGSGKASGRRRFRSSCSRRRRVRRRGRAAVAVPRVRRPRGAQLPRRPHARRHTGVGRANAAPAAGCRVDTPAALLVGRAASGDEEVHRQRPGRSRGARPGGRGRARPRSGARRAAPRASAGRARRRMRPERACGGARAASPSSRHDATPVLDDLDVVPAPKRPSARAPCSGARGSSGCTPRPAGSRSARCRPPEDAPDLGDAALRVLRVVERLDARHEVERRVLEWQELVRDDVRDAVQVPDDVEPDDVGSRRKRSSYGRLPQ